MDTPNLDEVVRWQAGSPVMNHQARNEAAQAQAELASLKAKHASLAARCADLSLMMHSWMDAPDGAWTRGPAPSFTGWIYTDEDGNEFELELDGTGLPLLTEEARKALEGEVGR